MDIFLKILSVSLTLFFLMDSLGNVPLFISILKDFDVKSQRRIIRRELLIALAFILGFYFFGEFFLNLIEIKHETILIAGGIILFLIAIQMVFSSGQTHKEPSIKRDPFIVPLAIPLVAGPAVLAAVMIYGHQQSPLITIPAIFIAWIASTLVLISASFLKKILGESGILACEKLMGLLLTLMAIQMCLKGITLYMQGLA